MFETEFCGDHLSDCGVDVWFVKDEFGGVDHLDFGDVDGDDDVSA